MLKYIDDQWYWNGDTYKTFKEAMSDMCQEITWNNITPEFGEIDFSKLTKPEARQVLLLYAIYNMSIPDLIQSKNLEQYNRLTKSHSTCFAEVIKNNPLFAEKFTIPMYYRINKSVHCSILPALKDIYSSYPHRVKSLRGKYSFDKVISFILDSVLFNYKTSPFKSVLDIFIELEAHKESEGLSERIKNEDLFRALVLTEQLKAGDVTTDEFITVGDLRRGSYPCKTKDKLGDIDYIETLSITPKALWRSGYDSWISVAFNDDKPETTPKKVVQPVQPKEPVLHVKFDDIMPPPIPPEEPTVVKELEQELPKPVAEEPTMRPDSDNEMLHGVATVYCTIVGAELNRTITSVRNMGVSGWEAIYRALPVYLRKAGKGVELEVLTEYCKALIDVYGDGHLGLEYE